MKLTTLLIVVAILQVSASTFTQKITLSEKNTPLNKVFEKISDQTSYDFIVSTENLKIAKPVTINVQSEDLKSVLDRIFTLQPLNFVIQDKIVVVSKKETTSINKVNELVIPPLTISGTVTDTIGQPLPGATLTIKGANKTGFTNANGSFSITANDGDEIEVSFVGFQRYIFIAKTSETFRKIILHEIPSKLNEVQVIGYGTTTRRLNTGSVVTINSDEIEIQPVSDPISALQGQASGVSIQTANGLPGGNVTVQIRGQGSIASGTNPLYIVDGVPYLSSPLVPGNGGANGANGPISPLSILNPQDIESISILKDADATAIYGSRGANGVVLITTKKGVGGKTNFTATVNQGFSEISRYNQFLNVSQYLAERREAFKNDGIIPTAANAPDLLVWNQTQNTNWQKYMFGNRDNLTNVQTSLTGGNENTNFIFSTNYRNEGSIFPGDENYKKGGGFLNLTHASPSKKFKVNLTINYELDDNHTLYSAPTFITQLPPNYPLYNTDGSLNFQSNNALALLQQRTHAQSNNLIVNGSAQYELFPGLILKTTVGYTRYTIDQLSTLPASSQDNTFFTPLAIAYQSNNSNESYIIEPQIDYKVKLKKGTLSALVGTTLQDQVMKGDLISESGVNNPALLGNIGAASTVTGSNSYSEYKYTSLFSRVNYDWEQKYLIDLNFRRDGSSRFGNYRQFGNFGAAGGAWIFSQEDFMHDQVPFLSFGKLRGSYGLTGNDQIADYQYLTAYGSSTIYGGTASLAPSRIANPDYSWETTRQLEIALELGFLKDRIMLTSAWYKRRSDNQLVAYPLPYQTGFASYQANLPAVVQNTGWEFDINTINLQGKNFSWKSTFNLTIPRNVLVSYPNLAGSTYANTLVVGQDLTVQKGYQYLGPNPQTGLPQFKDVNGDGIINTTDRVVIGKTSPLLYGGFGNTFLIYHLAINMFFEFRKQSSTNYKPEYGSNTYNDPTYVLGRWQQPGDQTNIPRFTTISSNITNLNTSSASFTDASYIRLKNISLSYPLATALVNRMGLKALSIYVEGQNILTFANKDRLDPEIPAGGVGIPPLRTFVGGLKITL